jgi:rsbT antagonist protein RsbS
MTRPEHPDHVPVIELWGHLLLHLQGDLTDTQMDAVSEAVLDRIRLRGADGLVIDASGVWMVDSHICAALARLAGSARLMGVPSVLCGLGPEVVMTLLGMGFDLDHVQTTLGLESALELLGIVVVRGKPSATLEGEE